MTIPLITSCCQAGLVGPELKPDEDIAHFRCILNGKTYVADKLYLTSADKWIKQDDYKDSIYNVIPGAIVDCALERNEFAKEKVKGGVVTFENKDYKHYTAANGNALVLYNYIKYSKYVDSNDYLGKYKYNSDAHIRDFQNKFIKNGLLSQACGEKYIKEIEKGIAHLNSINKKNCSINKASDNSSILTDLL